MKTAHSQDLFLILKYIFKMNNSAIFWIKIFLDMKSARLQETIIHVELEYNKY